MTHLKLSLLASLSTVLVSLAPSVASAAPKLLVTDFEAGSVLEFTALDGGDISGNVFASNLSSPAGICVGPNNDIYVAEFETGEITIITDGGDMTDVMPFAALDPMVSTLSPVGLWCNDQSVIVTDAAGVVADITIGGSDFNQWGVHVFYTTDPVPLVVDLARDTNGDFRASSSAGLLNANIGADGMAAPIVAPGANAENAFPIDLFGAQLLAGAAASATVLDISTATAFDTAPVFADLPPAQLGGVLALFNGDDQGLFAATYDGIYDISAGGDLTSAVPVATGLSPSGLAFIDMTFHDCSTDEDCLDDDLCNGAEVCSQGRCGEPPEPLDCNDDDVCTADSCDGVAGCGNDPIENCCISDLECAIDEICDLEDNECVPASSPTDTGNETSETIGDETGDPGSGTDTAATGTTGGATTQTTATTGAGTVTAGGAGSGETDGDTDTDGAGADESGGCSCSARDDGAPTALLLGLFALWVTRRRR